MCAQTLSFTVAAVAADPAQVKMPGGAVSAKVSEAASGAANIVSAITPGAQFTNIVLFIDTNQQTMTKVAETKWGWGGACSLPLTPFFIYSSIALNEM